VHQALTTAPAPDERSLSRMCARRASRLSRRKMRPQSPIDTDTLVDLERWVTNPPVEQRLGGASARIPVV